MEDLPNAIQWSKEGGEPPIHLRDPYDLTQTRCGLTVPRHAWETPIQGSRPCRRCTRSDDLDEVPRKPLRVPLADELPEDLRVRVDQILSDLTHVATEWAQRSVKNGPAEGAGFRAQTFPRVLAWVLARAHGTVAVTGAIKYLRAVGYTVTAKQDHGKKGP